MPLRPWQTCTNMENHTLQSSATSYTLSLHDALPISPVLPHPANKKGSKMATAEMPTENVNLQRVVSVYLATRDRKSTRLNSSHDSISYPVFCLKKKDVTQGIMGEEGYLSAEYRRLKDATETMANMYKHGEPYLAVFSHQLHSFPTRRSSDLSSTSAPCEQKREQDGDSRDADRERQLAACSVGVFGHERSEEHTSELQSRFDLVSRLLLEKKRCYSGHNGRRRLPLRRIPTIERCH